jgi:hypothetical protein
MRRTPGRFSCPPWRPGSWPCSIPTLRSARLRLATARDCTRAEALKVMHDSWMDYGQRPQVDKRPVGAVEGPAYSGVRGMDDNRALWSAPAERSDDGALASDQLLVTRAKAVSRCACHRSPKLPAEIANRNPSNGFLGNAPALAQSAAPPNRPRHCAGRAALLACARAK